MSANVLSQVLFGLRTCSRPNSNDEMSQALITALCVPNLEK